MYATSKQWLEAFKGTKQNNTRLFEYLAYINIDSDDIKEIEAIIFKCVGNKIIPPAHIIFAIRAYPRICKCDLQCIEKMYSFITFIYNHSNNFDRFVTQLAESYIEYKEKFPKFSIPDGAIFWRAVITMEDKKNCATLIHAIAITGNSMLFESAIKKIDNEEVIINIGNALHGTIRTWKDRADKTYLHDMINTLNHYIKVCDNKSRPNKTEVRFKKIPKGGFFSLSSHQTVFRKIDKVTIEEPSIWIDFQKEDEMSLYNAINCIDSSPFFISEDEICTYYPKAKLELKKCV